MKKRALLMVLALACAMPAVSVASTQQCQVPHDDPASYTDKTPKTQDIPAFNGLKGHYALPATDHPSTLVVMFHGYGNTSDSWVCHLLDAAENHDAVAVAMDYRGTGWTGAASDNRGWFVKEGAEDSIFAARYFLQAYPSIRNVVAFGISMGGNASGLAVAAGATRPDSSQPLFDYWVNVEGATSMIETYYEATALSPASSFAAAAVEDMQKECGGAPQDTPTCYRDITVLARTLDIKNSGIKGVIDVQGVDDGLVGHDQSEEMTWALRAAGVPTDYYIALRRNDWQNPATAADEGGTTLSGTVLGPVLAPAGQTWPAPLAGHGWEGSNTQIVIATGFAKMWSLLENHQVPANHQYLVDGDLGVQQLF